MLTLERRQLADSSVESEVQQKQNLEPKNCAQTDKPDDKSEKCRIQQQSTPGDSKLVEHVEEMLSGGFRDIKSNLKKLIIDKLNGINFQQNSFEISATSSKTYTNAARNLGTDISIRDICSVQANVSNFIDEKVIKSDNAEEISEKLDRQSRVNNLIIHGKQEVNAIDDEAFAKNLFKDIQVE